MPTVNRSTLVLGLILITVGVLVLLNNVGLIPVEVARLWPVLLVVLGVGLLGNSLMRRRGGGLMGGVMVLAVGVMLLLQNFDLVPGSAFGPVMVMAAGAGLLLRGLVRAP